MPGVASYNETRSRITRGVDLAWSCPRRNPTNHPQKDSAFALKYWHSAPPAVADEVTDLPKVGTY